MARAVLPALHVEPLRSSSVKTLGVIATLRAEACGGEVLERCFAADARCDEALGRFVAELRDRSEFLARLVAAAPPDERRGVARLVAYRVLSPHACDDVAVCGLLAAARGAPRGTLKQLVEVYAERSDVVAYFRDVAWRGDGARRALAAYERARPPPGATGAGRRPAGAVALRGPPEDAPLAGVRAALALVRALADERAVAEIPRPVAALVAGSEKPAALFGAMVLAPAARRAVRCAAGVATAAEAAGADVADDAPRRDGDDGGLSDALRCGWSGAAAARYVDRAAAHDRPRLRRKVDELRDAVAALAEAVAAAADPRSRRAARALSGDCLRALAARRSAPRPPRALGCASCLSRHEARTLVDGAWALSPEPATTLLKDAFFREGPMGSATTEFVVVADGPDDDDGGAGGDDGGSDGGDDGGDDGRARRVAFADDSHSH